jgi:Zn finger protein HypA/HybF involved in hydrogenase expression
VLKGELRQCKECRRLFSAAAKQTICPECSLVNQDHAAAVDRAVDLFDCRTIEEIVDNTGLPIEDVIRIVRQTPVLRERVQTHIRCERCRDRYATSDSRFCLECRVALNRAFAQATAELLNKIVRLADSRAHNPIGYQHMSVVRELRAKRAMTGMNRFDPTPRRGR